MERKYYLRGLGLGITVTAVIMGIALSGNQSMTNEEIIARAKELGLVENTVLSNTGSEDAGQENAVDNPGQDIEDQSRDDIEGSQNDLAAAGTEIDMDTEPSNAETDTDSDAADETEQESAPEENDNGANPAAEVVAGGEVQDEPPDFTADDAETEDDNEVAAPVTIKVITINSGDGSYTVAKKLENVGVVSSAATFDTFLCQNGYDKRLRTGTFSIPTDASDEQIARIVTGAE